MRFYTFADELSPGRQNEIPFQTLPYEVKFIATQPHVRAGTVDGVLLPFGAVLLAEELLDHGWHPFTRWDHRQSVGIARGRWPPS